MLLVEIDISIGGNVKYHLTYEYKSGVIAFIKSIDGSTCDRLDFNKHKEFKPILAPYSGNMLLTLPGLSHDFVFVKTPDKRLIRFIKAAGDDKLQPFDRLKIELNGTVFDGIVHYSLEGSSMKSAQTLRFDIKSTRVINALIAEKISEQTKSLVNGLLGF